VWSEGIVFLSPSFDEHLGLPEVIEDLSIQQFVSEFAVEAFAVAVFPWAARLDVQGSHPCIFKPLAHSLGSKFRAVVRSDVFRWPVGNKEIGEAMKHVIGSEASLHDDVEALPTEFVNDRQDLDKSAVVSAVFDKIIGPDMMAMGGPEPHTRPIIEPQTSAFGLLLRNLQPLLAPDAFHPLVIDLPTGSSEQGCNPAITVAPILLGKSDNFFPEPLFGVCQFGYGPLSRSRLTHYPTRTPLRYSQLVL
jgi:hypothetical protein